MTEEQIMEAADLVPKLRGARQRLFALEQEAKRERKRIQKWMGRLEELRSGKP